MTPCGSTIAGFEIALEGVDRIHIYNEHGPLSATYYLNNQGTPITFPFDITPVSTDCDLFIDMNGSGSSQQRQSLHLAKEGQGLLIIEIIEVDGFGGKIMHRLEYAGVPYPTDESTFYQPVGGGGGDYFMTPTCISPDDYWDDTPTPPCLPGSDWIVPYQQLPNDHQFVSAQVNPVGGPYTYRFDSDVTVSPYVRGARWYEEDLTLEFGPNAGLTLNEDLQLDGGAAGLTLKAADPQRGWKGITATSTGSLTVEGGNVRIEGGTHRFAPGKHLTVYGTLTTEGATFTERSAGQGWDGITVVGGGTFTATDEVMIKHAAVGLTVEAGAAASLTEAALWHNDRGILTSGDLTLTDSEVEGAYGGAAVAVFDPGTATISGSTLRDSRIGLDVRAGGGVTLAGSAVHTNGTGIRVGAPATAGGAVYCRSDCPKSELDVTDSEVRDNSGDGITAFFADLDVTGTEIRDNGGYGLYAVSSLVEDFQENLVVENGANGTWAGTAADLFLSPRNTKGENRIASNDGTEVVVMPAGFSFLGDDTGDTGDNAVFDPEPPPGRSPFLVRNYSQTLVDARSVYWGYPDGPPPGTIQEPVDTGLPLSCDPTPFLPSPDDPNVGSCFDNREAGPLVVPGRSQALAQSIQAARQALAATPGAAEADSLVFALGGLHRLDVGDASGEWGQTATLLASLRSTLSQPGLSANERAAGEAALQVEAVHGLGHGEVTETANLLGAWRPHVVSGEVREVLRLVEAALRARVGQYAQAAAVAQSVAAGEAEAEARAGLEALAAYYGERAAETGAGAQGTNPALAGLLGVESVAGEAARAAETAEVSLSVYPNPSASRGTVTVVVPASAHLRLAVFDVLGRRVAVLADGPVEAGAHGFAFDGAVLPAGVYLVRAEVGGARVLSERLTLVR